MKGTYQWHSGGTSLLNSSRDFSERYSYLEKKWNLILAKHKEIQMVLLDLNINHYYLKVSPNSYLDLLILIFLTHKNFSLSYCNQTIKKLNTPNYTL